MKIRNAKMRWSLMLLLFVAMAAGWEGAAAQGELGGEGWGYKFKPVMGWKHAGTEDALILLGHDTLPGMVFVYPHQEAGMAGLKNQMLRGVQEEDLQLKPSSPLQKLGNNAFVADYAGVAGSERAKARGIGNLSPYGGGGAYIFAVTTSEKYTKAYASAAEAIAKNMRFLKIDPARLLQTFAHRWTHLSSSGYRQTDLYFYPDGRYADSFEASYGGQTTDEFGHQDGHWGTVGTERGQGRWKVRGNFRRGQIIVTKGDGAETVQNYVLNVQDGETYWGEYLFNGEKYFMNDKGIYGTE